MLTGPAIFSRVRRPSRRAGCHSSRRLCRAGRAFDGKDADGPPQGRRVNSIALLLCLVSAQPDVDARPWSGFFNDALVLSDETPIVRGQSPGQPIGPLLGPQDQNTTLYQPTYQMDPFSGGQQPVVTPQPYGMPQPIQSGDPFLSGGMPYAAPSPNAPWGQYSYGGINGAQPIRYGWNARYDSPYPPSAGTSSSNVGKFGLFAFDLDTEHNSATPAGRVRSIAPP